MLFPATNDNTSDVNNDNKYQSDDNNGIKCAHGIASLAYFFMAVFTFPTIAVVGGIGSGHVWTFNIFGGLSITGRCHEYQ